jgi:hypothetical protein
MAKNKYRSKEQIIEELNKEYEADKARIQSLVGKTVEKITHMKYKDSDDTGFLKFKFTDGTSCVIEGFYSGYTGESRDEYPQRIAVRSSVKGLVAVK